MNKLKKIIGSTKFHVYLGNPAENTPIEIRIDGNTFYRVELGKKVKIGGVYETVELLHRYDARLAVKKGNRFKAYQFFFSKKDALNLLKEGYSVISVETLSTLSFDDEYTHIISSDGKSFEEGSLPCGSYCMAINEPKLPKTHKEVMAEKLFEEQRLKLEKERTESEARKGAARKLSDKIEERNRKEAAKNQLKRGKNERTPQQEPEGNGFNLPLKVAGFAAVFFLGFGLGKYFN